MEDGLELRTILRSDGYCQSICKWLSWWRLNRWRPQCSYIFLMGALNFLIFDLTFWPFFVDPLHEIGWFLQKGVTPNFNLRGPSFSVHFRKETEDLSQCLGTFGHSSDNTQHMMSSFGRISTLRRWRGVRVMVLLLTGSLEAIVHQALPDSERRCHDSGSWRDPFLDQCPLQSQNLLL